ncbi:MAG: M20/M25/M40 family metallo-hydrolase [Alphaproteobacteria bacterium]|nr:MAG: M20/M25/M40 family metallo-hydrolase [Alphaproteobacteria bacterium]
MGLFTEGQRKSLRTMTVLAACLGVAACAGAGLDSSLKDPRAGFSADRIRADVTFLADDTLKGRDTGSEGYRIAANYVAAEYARLGLKPAGENGSYFQEVPFQKAGLNQETARMTVTLDGTEKTLALGDDYYMSGSVRTPSGDASGQVVFVGYGVHAPDLDHDDLAGLDLEGKIVLMIGGAPASFNTEIRAHHGSSGTKSKEFAKRGAIGYITVNSLTNEKRRPFARLKKYLGSQDFEWVMPEGADTTPRVRVGAAVSHDVAAQLFAGAERSLDDVLAEAEEGSPKGFALKASVSMHRDSILSDTFTSPNVVAVLEGSDPKLKDEYVVLSAHLDHIGISENAKGEDKINNGALDNATGVAVMMEVARAYARSGKHPRRSILFAAVTAEEKGLLGAEYFAHFPTVDKKALVADVNLDMPVLLYDFSDVVAFGADRSSLGPITEQAVAHAGVTLSPDPMPEEGIFTRSDHYRFVQQGVPSVFLITGFGKTPDGKDGGEIFMHFLHNTYHSPADQMDQEIDFNAGAKFAYVNWLIASAIANGDKRPTWNDGDFFGRTFAR